MNTMTADNRQTPRILTSVPCFFGMNKDVPRNGVITSLSANGCFVKTKAVVAKSQTIFLDLCLPDEQRLPTEGFVLYRIDGIGFGLLFTEIKVADQSAVDEFVKRFLSSKQRPAAGLD